MQSDVKIFAAIIFIVCAGLGVWKLGKAWLFGNMDLIDLGILAIGFGGMGFSLSYLIVG